MVIERFASRVEILSEFGTLNQSVVDALVAFGSLMVSEVLLKPLYVDY